MVIKDLVDEDFQDYKKTSMFIATSSCTWKCCLESGCDISMCQNSTIAKQKSYNIQIQTIVERYLKNPISRAVVFGGLEPFDQAEDIIEFVRSFRQKTYDDVVIYTGYKEEEIAGYVLQLSQFQNVIIKFGRYIPNKPNRYDSVLGVCLASDNQYAKHISKSKEIA